MQNSTVQTLTLDEMTQLDAGATVHGADFSQLSDIHSSTSSDTINGSYSLESMWSFEA